MGYLKPVQALAETVFSSLDELFTSDEEREKLKNELERIALDYDFNKLKLEYDLAGAQAQINKEEAGNPNLFVAGWRPAVGWIGAFSLFYEYIFYPLFSPYITLVSIPNENLLTLITGMLGLGTMRSFDKMKSTDTKGVKLTNRP